MTRRLLFLSDERGQYFLHHTLASCRVWSLASFCLAVESRAFHPCSPLGQAAQGRGAGKHNAAEERRRRAVRKKLEVVVLQCRKVSTNNSSTVTCLADLRFVRVKARGGEDRTSTRWCNERVERQHCSLVIDDAAAAGSRWANFYIIELWVLKLDTWNGISSWALKRLLPTKNRRPTSGRSTRFSKLEGLEASPRLFNGTVCTLHCTYCRITRVPSVSAKPISPHSFSHGHQSLASMAKGLTGKKGSGGGESGSLVFTLRDDGPVTSDTGCGRIERTRREKARALRFRAAVFVNGSKVRWCFSDVWPGNTIHVDNCCFHRPRQRLGFFLTDERVPCLCLRYGAAFTC